jgi:CheY-like chemotaxis protein
MGLTRCLGIVRRHGGDISVETEEAKGSIFTVILPMAAKPLEEKAPPLKATVDFKLTILVVDDSEPIAKLLERVLTDHGQTVFTALSGREGIRIFEEVHVDVVICDLVMPKMDGWQVATNIIEVCRQRGSEKPPFILLTAAGLARTEKEKLDRNRIDRVCHKPINVQQLLKMIGDLTRMRPSPDADK